jgi:hypothetical protein
LEYELGLAGNSNSNLSSLFSNQVIWLFYGKSTFWHKTMDILIFIHEYEGKLEFWGIYQIFPKKFEPPINLAQIQT